MGSTDEGDAVQNKVASREHEKILDTIDKIIDQGISRYVYIPQIMVCGDWSWVRNQSVLLNILASKSSTLEAICGVRFEVGDGTYRIA